MKWFQRKTQKQITTTEPIASGKTPTSENQSSETKESEPQGLSLLLIRPSVSKIFENPPDNSLIDADVVNTSFGMYDAKGMNRHSFERVPMLCVIESGHVGYTIPMRLDLQICLHQLATSSKSPIDYPLGLFTNRDVLVITDGLYKVMMMYHDAGAAMRAIDDKTNEFHASKIIWAGTTTEEVNINNLRRLEAAAKRLLTKGTNTPPRLLPKVDSDWQHDFLEPIFNHAKEKIKETQQ